MKQVYIPILGTVILCGACSGGSGAGMAVFDMELYKPRYASGFDIRGAEGRQSVVISVYNPWQGADSATSHLYIARGGESAPDGFDGQVVNGEARRIVTMSSTHIAMLDALGAVDRVVGVSGMDYITNEAVQAGSDSIADVGYEGNVDYELLLSLRPDLVLIYGVNGASRMERKLAELGVPYMYVGDYLEESPMGKAEWMVVLGEVAGIRDVAERMTDSIAVRYDSLSAVVANAALDAPTVMLNTPYGDSWFMPSPSNYMARLIKDAGGDYIYKSGEGNRSVSIDLEEAYDLTCRADMWLNVGEASTLDELKALCPKMSDSRCVSEGYVYNNNARRSQQGGNDFYESAVVHPDVVLSDLIGIFHPELSDEGMIYYRRLR